MSDFFHQVPATDDCTCDNVRMTVQVFCSTVKRKIKSQFRWSEVDRAGESIVDYRDYAVGSSKFDDILKMGHAHQGIGYCFNIDCLRVRFQLSFPRIGIASIDEIVRDAEVF